MPGLHNSPKSSMMAFTAWLADAFETFSATAPFYTERLWAFNKLNQSTFVASQKEDYHWLGEMFQLLTRHPYGCHLSMHSFLPVEVGGYAPLPEAVTLTFVNGICVPSQDAHQGVQLRRLADLSLLEQKEVLTTYMADLGSTNNDLFVMLNKMLSQESYLLEIALDRLIILQHIVTDSVCHVVPQLMVKVSQGSQVTIIENWYTVAHKAQPFVNNFTHILLEEATHLSYHTLYIDAPSCYQVNTLYCNQKDHSTFTHHSFAFSAAMLHMQLRVQINGNDARANLYGLSTLAATEKVAQQIQVIHSAPHSFSQQHYKAILSGQSIGSFSGKIYLTPAAQRTNAYQTNNVLMLSDAAHHYAKPQLEIYADDVKCSHGATAGQLDEAQIFYLQARGIGAPLAKRLLLEAFGGEIIDSVVLVTLQDYLYDQLVAKLMKL